MRVWAAACDEATRRLLEVACREAGHSLRLLDNLANIPAEAPSLVFVDTVALGSDPGAALAPLRQRHSGVFVALVTGETLDSTRIKMLEALAIGAYISKPPTLSDLAGLLRKAGG